MSSGPPDDLTSQLQLAAQRVLDSEASFAILASGADDSQYVQWTDLGGGIHVEIADPAYNDKRPLGEAELAAISDLGFVKGAVNYERAFAPGEHDASSLAELVLECHTAAFGPTNPSQLELSVDS